ncbi:MAG: metallophosphoesterase, partial [Holophaga sp.]|nr:metallophosphoesterase [Holophaga sp.]
MKNLLRLLLVVAGLTPNLVWCRPPKIAVPPITQIETSDGPHVLWNGKEATVAYVREGRVTQQKVEGSFDLLLPGIAAQPVRLSPEPKAADPGTPNRPEKILAVSDIHGRFDTLSRLLQAQKVVDANLRWQFGNGHLVVVGDVMDRGPQVTEAYWFLHALEQSARSAGGAVHMLLGNHEAMLLAGDYRYVHSKYQRPPTEFPSLGVQYGTNSELGRWLRSRPALLRLGDILFVHGGISPETLKLNLDLDQINDAIRQSLGLRAKDTSGTVATLLGSAGPLWYRGLLPEGGNPQASDDHIAQVLTQFKVKTLMVGHTTLRALASFHGGRIFGIDAGIKDGEPGEAMLFLDGRAWRAKADGTREAF